MNIAWLKLDVNIMDDEKMYIILDRSDGDKLFRLWIGILCLGMKSGRPGLLEIGDCIPYRPETLAARLRFDRSVVEKGIELFQSLNMVEVCENGTIIITNFEKHQSLESIEKRRALSRKTSQTYRKKQKLLADGDTSRDGHVTHE